MTYEPHQDPVLLALALKAGQTAENLVHSKDSARFTVDCALQDMLDRLGAQIDAKIERTNR